ncbi:glycosyltransferase family A protein [Microbacterium paraoxydans]|uniref:Glycosyltransferase family 2 protein n=1 Tax=Microbacterium paraoxydans TaxID=199592 RepID=A0ABS5IRX2_9MICO|nr:glycosyltransferase family A protein [Microbacterium paraoxydans]MBS0025600.1 glycosyltransferase family 2 protein [Microbacterium paraoxydans]
MESPLVDVTIAVHSATRPVARAVASVIEGTTAPVRVTVVAHNIDQEIIRANLGTWAEHPAVRLLSLRDGIPSPAGPMNLGMAEATARFHALLGSDDEFAPGAIDSWLALQRATSAEVVIGRIRLITGGPDPYPPVRGGRRTTGLSADRDRLHYRSAPLGLVDRERFGKLRLTEGLISGEDLPYSSELWMTAKSIAYDLYGPPYIVHDDAEDRVTSAPRDVAADFAFLRVIEEADWFAKASAADRRSLAVKLLRIHFFDAVAARLDTPGIAAVAAELLAVVDRVSAWAPGVLSVLSIADRRVIDELRRDTPDPERTRGLLGRRWIYLSPAAQLPRNPFLALHRHAPFRTLAAGARSQREGQL